MEKQRLDKFISNQLCMSRSETRTAIRRGKVAVSDKLIRDPSAIIDVESDKVVFEDKEIKYKRYIYIMLNKPAGVLSAASDKARETVVDLVPKQLARAGLFPVGRLDKDTTGLLLITDDGCFAHNCISPKKDIPKVYEVVLDGKIKENMPDEFLKGVVLADGTVCKSADLEIIDSCKARVTITEGKYHQIKRMFGVFDLGVVALKRISIGDLILPDDLKNGECREITPENLKKYLKNAF